MTLQSTSTTANKTVVRNLIDGLFSRGDLDAVNRYLDEGYVDHDPPFGVSPDRDGMRDAARMVRASFPDWRSELHLLIAEGDHVAEHFTARGTHSGELLGIPATGRTASLNGVNVFRLREGRIVERWGRHDVLGFLQDLGVAPARVA